MAPPRIPELGTRVGRFHPWIFSMNNEGNVGPDVQKRKGRSKKKPQETSLVAVRHKPQPDRQTIFLPKQGMPNSGIAMTHPASFSKNKSPSSALSHKLQSQVYFYWAWVTISRLWSCMYWVHKNTDHGHPMKA